MGIMIEYMQFNSFLLSYTFFFPLFLPLLLALLASAAMLARLAEEGEEKYSIRYSGITL